jgi:hypothetical protein
MKKLILLLCWPLVLYGQSGTGNLQVSPFSQTLLQQNTAAQWDNLLGVVSTNFSGSVIFTGQVIMTNGANQIGGNGVLLTNLSTTYLTTTNFSSRNVTFVDAGNGSDLFEGSERRPWATIQHAQTNTPASWTLAVNPGVYAQTATNETINYYLATGANVTFNFSGPTTTPTVNIAGTGNVILGNTLTTAITLNITAALVICTNNPDFAVTDNSHVTIHTQYAALSLDNLLNVSTNCFIIFADRIDFLGGIGAGDGSINVQAYAKQCMTFNDQFNNGEGLADGSIIQTPIGINVNGAGLGWGGTGNVYWDVGYDETTNSDGFTSMIFLNDPLFQLAPSVSSCKGAYQVQ